MRDYEDNRIEPLIDGFRSLIQKNLVAHTPLIADGHVGDNFITVDNALRFQHNDDIIIMDNTSVFNIEENRFENFEFHKVDWVAQSNTIYLKDRLQRDVYMSNNGRIQKAIQKAILYEKDVYYGDRAVIPADHVAICIEPDSLSNDWVALQMLNNEYNLSLMVYVKSFGQGAGEELALRICNAYAAALYDLCINNIHLDLVVDEVQLKYDAHKGDRSIKIPIHAADDWPPDECPRYEIQDNNHAESAFPLATGLSSSSESSTSASTSSLSSSSSSSVSSRSSSSSSSSSISSSILETTSSTQLMTSSQSSTTQIFTSSTSSVVNSWEQSSTSSSNTLSTSSSSRSSLSSSSSSNSSSSSSSLSSSSLSSSSPSSSSDSSMSSSSISSSPSLSTSSWVDYYEVFLTTPLLSDYLVKDKAVLRRKVRYMYDSRVKNIEYGTTNKGSAVLKVARLSWFGKETKDFYFPQVGKGGYIYDK